jgi:PEP-CTERM motif
VVDATDIDLLVSQVRDGGTSPYYDINGDDTVDQADTDYFIRNLLNTEYGDANLDGQVSDADYTMWADNYGATGAGWAMGDFTGNGAVTEADYTVWADNYGAGAGTAGVPEPATLSMLALGAVALVRRRK